LFSICTCKVIRQSAVLGGLIREGEGEEEGEEGEEGEEKEEGEEEEEGKEGEEGEGRSIPHTQKEP
jgi:hypothetical protein